MNRPLTIAAFLFIAFLLVVLLIWPKYQELQRISQEINNKKTELEYKTEYFANLSQLEEELKKYEPSLAKIDSALPPNPSLPALFDYLQKVSAQNGLVLTKIGTPSLTPSKTKEKVKEIRLELALSGSYPSLKNLLSTFYRSARMVEIESISFSSSKGGEIFSFKLTIKTQSY